jgi:hypothetical protein
MRTGELLVTGTTTGYRRVRRIVHCEKLQEPEIVFSWQQFLHILTRADGSDASLLSCTDCSLTGFVPSWATAPCTERHASSWCRHANDGPTFRIGKGCALPEARFNRFSSTGMIPYHGCTQQNTNVSCPLCPLLGQRAHTRAKSVGSTLTVPVEKLLILELVTPRG